jgi:hypothetical protein
VSLTGKGWSGTGGTSKRIRGAPEGAGGSKATAYPPSSDGEASSIILKTLPTAKEVIMVLFPDPFENVATAKPPITDVYNL